MPLNRRLPKRGFNHQKRHALEVVNVDVLDRVFEAGAEVTQSILVAAGLVADTKGGVKVLGRGELTKKLTIKVQAISPGARTKIEAAGGAVEVAPMPKKSPEKAAETADVPTEES